MSSQLEEKKFFGRKVELELLKRRVLGLKEGYRQNIAFLGNPYIGKTYCLQYFLDNLDDADVTAIVIDVEQKDFTSFFQKFIGSLLYNFSKNKNLPLHEDIQLLIESVKKHIPLTVSVINRLQQEFQKGHFDACFLGLMHLPEVYTNETGKFALVVIDEFQNIEDLFGVKAFQDLGKKIMTQKKCLYVLVSSYPAVAKKILAEKLSLLFGSFEIIQMDNFDVATSQSSIQTHLENCHMGIQLKNFLVDFTAGHPLYLNLISQEMFALSSIYRQQEIYLPILSQAIENTLFNRWGTISRHFELIINELSVGKGNQIVISLLLALANGRYKMEEISGEISSSKNLIKQKIQKLQEVGLLIKNGNYYYLKDKVFRYWIKFIYQKRLKGFSFSSEKNKKMFKDEFHLAFERFKTTSRQDFSVRVMDLLSSFDNETVDLNGRMYKLPSFRKLEPIKLKDESGCALDAVKAIADDETWFILIKKENCHEKDVGAFVQEIKRSSKRLAKFLIISLSDLDEHVRLKALQERFWIWNQGELNTLLTILDKPFILR